MKELDTCPSEGAWVTVSANSWVFWSTLQWWCSQQRDCEGSSLPKGYVLSQFYHTCPSEGAWVTVSANSWVFWSTLQWWCSQQGDCEGSSLPKGYVLSQLRMVSSLPKFYN